MPINRKKSNVHLILCNFIKRAASLFHWKSRGYSKYLCLPLFSPRRWVLRLLFVLVSDTQNAPTAQKMKFSIRDFFSKCDQIHRTLQIWSHLLKKSLMESFIFFAVPTVAQERLQKFCDSKKTLKIYPSLKRFSSG